jgi:hypothetical protein
MAEEQGSDAMLEKQIEESEEDIDLNREVVKEGLEQAAEEERFDQAEEADDGEDDDPTDTDPPEDEDHDEFDPLPPEADV